MDSASSSTSAHCRNRSFLYWRVPTSTRRCSQAIIAPRRCASSQRPTRGYDEFFVQLEVTLALAFTETVMLADALIDPSAAVPAHATALPPSFPDDWTT